MTTLRCTALAFAMTLLAASAVAQGRDEAFFKQLDQNGDGVIDREELSLEKGAILYQLDKNRSLELEQNETKLPPDKFRQYAGEDGVIDGGEMFNMPEIQFEAFDRNGDQKISREEYRRQMASIRAGTQAAESR